MKVVAGTLLLAILLAPWGPVGADPQLVVVAHPSIAGHDMDRSTLRRIYLGDQRELGGQRILPVLNTSDAAMLRQFSIRILGMTVSRARGYWAQLEFSGRGEPPVQLSENETVLAFIAANPGAISFVDAIDGLPDSVSIVSLPLD